jgi:superfamily I DNA/RNA helicase
MSFTPTDDQEKIIQFEPSGNLLIRGEAGSGKTTVLAKRGEWIREQAADTSMLFLTYNAALERYVERVMAAEGFHNIEVTTFHSWVRRFVTEMGGEWKPPANQKQQGDLLQQALDAQAGKWKEHRLFSQPKTFWKEEFEWIFGQAIQDKNTYLNAVRSGRGSQIRVARGEDRECVWCVFASYANLLSRHGQSDNANIAQAVLDVVRENNGQFPERLRFDHVFIDEVQDFDAAWLLSVAPIPRYSLTLAGDLAQRIYRRTFTWKSVGIPIPASRSKKLQGSHRTTKQIMEVAQYLATNEDLKADEDYLPPTIPNRQGPKVVRINRSKWWAAQDEAVSYASQLVKRHPSDTFVLAAQFNKSASKLGDALKKGGVPHQVASGRDINTEPGEVLVTTFHQLKGLEFDHVILTGMEDGTVPGFYLKLDSSETPEERMNYLKRLVYVAMTRARKTCCLVGGTPFSRFFDEVPLYSFENR